MLNFSTDTTDDTKCYATHGVFGHVDPKQPPVKRKPFSAILKHDFVQKVELILPDELYEVIKNEIPAAGAAPAYSRVILPLQALLEGDFFNEYIKKGNIMMLSQGQLGVDNVYSLREGVLTLHLDKESYERAGLVGQPEGVKGKRGTKPRWVVEINLRLPSMLHGKKGFDRIVYAFKNVLTIPVTWLFLDLGTGCESIGRPISTQWNHAEEQLVLDPKPIDAHFPVRRNLAVQTTLDIQVLMPSLLPPTESEESEFYGTDFDDYAAELHEWLSLIMLDSPRVLVDDNIDAYLSRYVPPGAPSTTCKLVKVTWSGFMSAFWVRDVFVQILQTVPRESWFAFGVYEFSQGSLGTGKGCSILKLPKTQPKEYMLWEIA